MHKIFLILFLVVPWIYGCNPTDSVPLGATPTPTPPAIVEANATDAPLTPVDNPQSDEDGECESKYYPIQDDATWTYSLAGAAESTLTMSTDPVDESEFTVTVTTLDGTSQQKGHCTDEGVAFWDEAGLSAIFQSLAGTTTAATISNVGVSLPPEIEPGDTWNQTLSVAGSDTGIVSVTADFVALAYETITVSAGDFDTIKIQRSSIVQFGGNQILEETTEWYAEDVGLVKRETNLPGMPVLPLELVTYDIPDN
jgi:hypothetical protein